MRQDIALDTWQSPREVEASRRRALAKGVTLDQLFEEYLDDGDLRPRTRGLYEYQWRRLISPSIGGREIVGLTPTDVAEWRAKAEHRERCWRISEGLVS